MDPVRESNWSDSYELLGQRRREYPVDVPELDAGILTSGAVFMYVRVPESVIVADKVSPLPWTFGVTKGIAQVLGFELAPDSIVIHFYDLIDDSVDPGTFGSAIEYRYVIVPGGTSASTVPKVDYRTLMDRWGIAP